MNWTKKEIFKTVKELEQITGLEMMLVRELPKNAKIKELNIAWEQDRNWLRGMCTEIETRI